MVEVFLLSGNATHCQMLKDLLRDTHKVQFADNWEEAHQQMISLPPSIILIDYSLQNDKGPEFIKKVRACKVLQSLPVIVIIERNDTVAVLKSFDHGADDVICRPLQKEELLVRMVARMRDKVIHSAVIHCENLKVCYKNQQVWIDGKEIFLTPREFKLLTMLLSDPERILQRDVAIKEIWKEVVVSPRNVDTQMNNLKKKLKDFKGQIISVTGVGYKVLSGDRAKKNELSDDSDSSPTD